VSVKSREELQSHADALDVDVALETAIDLLDGSICECGHAEGSHLTDPDECRGDDSNGCERGCNEFRPVAFRVERAL
jgi:hypothetical protein